MGFLADLGVDSTSVDELVELSIALEHQQSITFLEDLKGFVRSRPSRQDAEHLALDIEQNLL